MGIATRDKTDIVHNDIIVGLQSIEKHTADEKPINDKVN